jgi:hypothetical protein
MAIDYDSATGVFTKMGRVIRVHDILESFELNEFATRVAALDSHLVLGIEKDQTAKSYMLQLVESFKSSMSRFREQTSQLVADLLAGELIEEEKFHTSEIQECITFVNRCLIRDDVKVTHNDITLTPSGVTAPSQESIAPTVMIDRNIAGYHAFPEEIAHVGTFKVTCEEITNVGRESYSVRGTENIRVSGPGDVNYEKWGEQLSILSQDSQSSENILKNGSFLNRSGANYFPDNWELVLGTWGTHILINTSSPVLRRVNTLEFAGVSHIKQMIPASNLILGQLYVLFFYIRRSAAGALGDLTVWLGDSSLVIPAVAIPSASWEWGSVWLGMIGTQDELNSQVVSFDRSGVGLTGSFYVSDITLLPLPRISNKGISLIIYNKADYPDVGESFTFAIANSHGGRFQTFFGRYFNRSLMSDTMSGGGTVITNSLCE